jgi:hypothetical protein
VFTVSFWKATAERVVTAFAVSLISALFVGAEVLDVRAIHWEQALSIAAGAALLSLLKGLVAGTGVIGPKGSPSLVRDPAAANPTCAWSTSSGRTCAKLSPSSAPSRAATAVGT